MHVSTENTKDLILHVPSVTYCENFPSTNLNRPISYTLIGIPSHIYEKISKEVSDATNKNKDYSLPGKKNETHIPDYCFPIIAGAHSYPWIERVDIQDIGLPKGQK